MDSQKHIYEYVSSSGSHRVCTIRLSIAGSSSYGFGLGLSALAEFVHKHYSSPFPSEGTCLPTLAQQKENTEELADGS